MSISAAELTALRGFIQRLSANDSSLLFSPSLDFFREWMISVAPKVSAFKEQTKKESDGGKKGGVIHISSDDLFEKTLKSHAHDLSFVDFSAEWCGPCKVIGPVFERLSGKYAANNIHFYKIDIDHCKDTAASYNIQSVPTFIAFIGKKVVDTLKGAHEAALENFIKKHTANVESAAKAESANNAPVEADAEEDMDIDIDDGLEILPRPHSEASINEIELPSGDADAVVSDADSEKADALKGAGKEAFEAKDYKKAIHHYSEAIKLNPQSTMLFFLRADALLALKRPEAAIRDCDFALKLNPDYARAYRVKGKSLIALAKFAEAYHELSEAQRIDYNDSINDLLKKVKNRIEKMNEKKKTKTKKTASESSSSSSASAAPTTESNPPPRPQPVNKAADSDDEEFHWKDDQEEDGMETEEAPIADDLFVLPSSDHDIVNESEHKFGEEKELTDEELEKATSEKSAGKAAMEEKRYDDALKHLNAAISLNPKSTLLIAARAEVFLALKKPNSAIYDCKKGLELNPDSAKIYKLRGRAHTMMGNFLSAHSDFATGQRIDFDSDTQSIMKKVQVRVDRVRGKEQKQKEKEVRKQHAFEEWQRKKLLKKREQERKKREEEEERRKAEQHHHDDEDGHGHSHGPGGHSHGGGFPGMGGMGGMGGFPGMAGMGGMPGMGGMGGGFPGMGGMAGMGGMPGMGGGRGGGRGGGMGGIPPEAASMMNDPEIMAGLQDPDIMAALQGMMGGGAPDPSIMNKPKVKAFMEKMTSKLGGGGGRGAGGRGGFPGMGGMGGFGGF